MFTEGWSAVLELDAQLVDPEVRLLGTQLLLHLVRLGFGFGFGLGLAAVYPTLGLG